MGMISQVNRAKVNEARIAVADGSMLGVWNSLKSGKSDRVSKIAGKILFTQSFSKEEGIHALRREVRRGRLNNRPRRAQQSASTAVVVARQTTPSPVVDKRVKDEGSRLREATRLAGRERRRRMAGTCNSDKENTSNQARVTDTSSEQLGSPTATTTLMDEEKGTEKEEVTAETSQNSAEEEEAENSGKLEAWQEATKSSSGTCITAVGSHVVLESSVKEKSQMLLGLKVKARPAVGRRREA